MLWKKVENQIKAQEFKKYKFKYFEHLSIKNEEKENGVEKSNNVKKQWKTLIVISNIHTIFNYTLIEIANIWRRRNNSITLHIAFEMGEKKLFENAVNAQWK